MIDKKKLFIADPSPSILNQLVASAQANKYQIETATSGADCFDKIKTFLPDLIMLDLFLPEIHGISILKQIKRDPQLIHKGVIITSDHILLPNYHSAIKEGACYFLNKPFLPDHFFTLVERYFLNKLQPEPFHGFSSQLKQQPVYIPQLHRPNHYLRFWGTRGSNTVSGAEFLRFGGNTCCLEIQHDNDRVIIDAGTGICRLGEKLSLQNEQKYHLFISHTHWDHVTGFPFFQPLYNTSSEIDLWAPSGFEKRAEELFTEMLAYTYFPIRLDEIRAKINFKEIREGCCIQIGGIKIWTHYAFHPGVTLCFKIQAGDKTFGYVTDNEFLIGYHGDPKEITRDHPLMQAHLSLIDFFKGCDFIIHEAQYFPEEYLSKVGWGHSSITNATILIRETNIKEWIITHHDPYHTDETLEKKLQLHQDILKDCQIDSKISFAYDGLIYPL